MTDRIKVPEGMLKAVYTQSIPCMVRHTEMRRHLEAALGWLAENPMVPTSRDIQMMSDSLTAQGDNYHSTEAYCAEWQRRCFLDSEDSGSSDSLTEAPWLSGEPVNPEAYRVLQEPVVFTRPEKWPWEGFKEAFEAKTLAEPETLKSEWKFPEPRPEFQGAMGGRIVPMREFPEVPKVPTEVLETLDAYEGVTGAFGKLPEVPAEAIRHIEYMGKLADKAFGADPAVFEKLPADEHSAHIKAHLGASWFGKPVRSTEDIVAAVMAAKGLGRDQDAATQTGGGEAVPASPDDGGCRQSISGSLETSVREDSRTGLPGESDPAPVERTPREFPNPTCPKCRLPMTDDGGFFTCSKGACRQKPIPVEDVRERYERERGE